MNPYWTCVNRIECQHMRHSRDPHPNTPHCRVRANRRRIGMQRRPLQPNKFWIILTNWWHRVWCFALRILCYIVLRPLVKSKCQRNLFQVRCEFGFKLICTKLRLILILRMFDQFIILIRPNSLKHTISLKFWKKIIIAIALHKRKNKSGEFLICCRDFEWKILAIYSINLNRTTVFHFLPV